MAQDAEIWELLQELFFLVETTPEADRERVLIGQCDDEDLRQRVLRIFRASSLEGSAPNEPMGAAVAGKLNPYMLTHFLR